MRRWVAGGWGGFRRWCRAGGDDSTALGNFFVVWCYSKERVGGLGGGGEVLE